MQDKDARARRLFNADGTRGQRERRGRYTRARVNVYVSITAIDDDATDSINIPVWPPLGARTLYRTPRAQ